MNDADKILAILAESDASARKSRLCVPNVALADEDGDTCCLNCGIGIYVGEGRSCPSAPRTPICPTNAALRIAVEALVKLGTNINAGDERHGWIVNALRAILAQLEKKS